MDLFTLFARIGLKDDGFEKGINDATAKGESFGSKFGGVVAGVGKATVAGLAVAATAFTGLAVTALKFGGDLEQNMGGAEAVFKDFAEGMVAEGQDAFKNMGLATSDFLATANKMGALLQGSGLNIEESFGMSIDMMQRASDVASIMGLDTSAAMDAVTGAAKGNFTMMDNLGVSMNATSLEAYALSKGINTSWNEMDNASKVTLAYQMFMESTAYAAGNYAKENETLAGSLGTAGAAMKNFLDGSGDVDQLVESFSNAADVIVNNLEKLLPRLATGIGDIMAKLVPKIPPLISKLLPAVIQGGVALMGGLVSAMPALTNTLVGILPTIVQAIMTLAPQLMTVGIQIIAQLITGITSMLPTLIPMAIETIIQLVNALIENAPLVLEAALQLVTGLANGILTALPVLIEALPSIITGIIDYFVSAIPLIIETGINLLTSIIAELPTIISSITDKIPEIINSIISALQILFPQIISAGVDLFISLVEALPEIIDTVIKAIPAIIESVLEAIISSLPLLIQAGIDLFVALVGALPAIIIAIVAAIPQIIAAVVDGIIGSIDQLILAGFQLFVALIQNLPAIIVAIVKAVPEIITAIVDEFGKLAYKIVELGTNLIQGIWKGINDAKDWLMEKISGFFGGVVDSIKDFFGIESPSKLMAQIGKFTAQGFVNGILGMASAVDSAMESTFGGFDGTDISASLGGIGGVAMDGGGGIATTGNNYNLYMQSTPQSPYEAMLAAQAVFDRARWQ